MDDRRALTDSGYHPFPLDAIQQCRQIRIHRRILTHYGVLYADTYPIFYKPRYRVESGELVRTHVVLILEINNERRAGQFRNRAIATLEPLRIPRIAARQHHHGWKFIKP
jgi:hypothetical protein